MTSVLLPAPLRPTSAVQLPAGNVRLTPDSAERSLPGYVYVTPAQVMVSGLASGLRDVATVCSGSGVSKISMMRLADALPSMPA